MPKRKETATAEESPTIDTRTSKQRKTKTATQEHMDTQEAETPSTSKEGPIATPTAAQDKPIVLKVKS